MVLSASELEAIKSSLETWELIDRIATGVVILGVVGEYVADFTKFAERRKIERPLSKLSCLVLIVGLVFEMWGLVKTSVLSGQIIEHVGEQAETARLRANELEWQIQPRYLTKKQQESVQSAMKPFAGIGFLITSHRLDAEGRRLALQVKSALNAGLKQNPARISQGGLSTDANGRPLETPCGSIPGDPLMCTHSRGTWRREISRATSLQRLTWQI